MDVARVRVDAGMISMWKLWKCIMCIIWYVHENDSDSGEKSRKVRSAADGTTANKCYIYKIYVQNID